MTAYEMRISDWSSDVCSSDLTGIACQHALNEVDLVPLIHHDVVVHPPEQEVVGDRIAVVVAGHPDSRLMVLHHWPNNLDVIVGHREDGRKPYISHAGRRCFAKLQDMPQDVEIESASCREKEGE